MSADDPVRGVLRQAIHNSHDETYRYPDDVEDHVERVVAILDRSGLLRVLRGARSSKGPCGNGGEHNPDCFDPACPFDAGTGPLAVPTPRDAQCEREDVEAEVARDLTLAVMRFYGYTDADIAEAEAVHPGRVCREEECYDEDGRSVHPKVYDELRGTASTVVEVVAPFLTARTAALREQVARVEALAPVLELADELRGVPPYEGLEAVSTAWVVGRLRAATSTDPTTDAARAVDAENGGEHG